MDRVQVYAVVRFDRFASASQDALVVKEILPTQQEAEAEVERLNALVKARHIDAIYFWQTTRYVPGGRGSEDTAEDSIDEL